MASELYVETLKGLTSGANANKVIIPSGQTLDASAGGFTPASGQVVNHQYYTTSTRVENTTDSFIDLWSVSYTPVLSSSLIYFMWSCAVRASNNSSADARASVRTVVDGTTYKNTYDLFHYDYGNSGAWHQMVVNVTSFKNNTDGSSTTHAFQGACEGSDDIVINTSTSNSSSFLHILEIAG